MSRELHELGSVTTIVMGLSPKGENYNRQGIGLPLLNGPTEFGPFHPNCTLFTTDSKRKCEQGDLIFCVRGNTTGRMNWADQKYSLGRGVCSIRGATPEDTKYIRYCIEVYLPKLLQMAGGSTMPTLTQFVIKQFRVPYPPSRNKIASILSAYDDLIENNTRRIKILEEMAQRIYREWFVNFRFPGHEKVKMVDSPLGKIPDGWEVGTINDMVTIKSGFAFKSKTFVDDGDFGLVTIKNVQEGRFITTCQSTLNDIPNKMPDYCYLSTGDILLSLTGNIGRVCLVHGVNYLLNQRVAKLSPNSDSNRAFVYFTFRNSDLQKRLEMISIGVAQQNLSPVLMGELKFVIPTGYVLANYSTICEPIVDEILLLNKTKSNLRQTRDLLLPKLISGELDVSELDIEIGDLNG